MIEINLKKKIEDYPQLSKSLKTIRKILREIIIKESADLPYPEERKIWELDFYSSSILFLRKKWILEIMWELTAYNELKFNELKRNIIGISSGILGKRLKDLEKNGLIVRNVLQSRPPSVSYHLSEKGNGFVELVTLIILFLKDLY